MKEEEKLRLERFYQQQRLDEEAFYLSKKLERKFSEGGTDRGSSLISDTTAIILALTVLGLAASVLLG